MKNNALGLNMRFTRFKFCHNLRNFSANSYSQIFRIDQKIAYCNSGAWLGISCGMTPGLLRTLSVLAGCWLLLQVWLYWVWPALDGRALCQQLGGVLHHHQQYSVVVVLDNSEMLA